MASHEVQEMLDRMSDRMAELMSKDPDWREEASEIEEMLERSDIFVLRRERHQKHGVRACFRPLHCHIWRAA
jgi:hypothetical protein